MPTIFKKRLKQLNSSPEKRRWLYLPYDQVTDKIGALSREDPSSLGLILIENPFKAARRPYHKQKLALILANLRHFALEQAQRGVAVRHEVVTDSSGLYSSVLSDLATELGQIEVMEPAERELRFDLAPAVEKGAIKVVAHEGWLSGLSDLEAIAGKDGYRMDLFYRRLRQKTGILMEGGKPVGDKYSFDSENRQAWKGQRKPPQLPCFQVDEITEEVGQLIAKYMSHHPGVLNLEYLPAKQSDADELWQWALTSCLPFFGPFEDAMSTEYRNLFHSRISAVLNIHRLIPKQIVQDVLSLPIDLPSQEGFIRQVLGWREFMHNVHVATDGFRQLETAPITMAPGDGGYKLWSGKDFSPVAATKSGGDGGACPSFFNSKNEVPQAYWGAPSGLKCLDTVVASVWEEAYSHHITRLMVLSNIATLLDISPRDLTDWFWVAYSDAYDWVVEPNVLAMSTYGTGGLITTKPYISGAAYINKMSDYCKGCQFDPQKNCPITKLYWAFLERHEEKLRDNIRMAMPLNSLKRRAQSLKDEDRKVFKKTLACLMAGEKLDL